MPGARLARIAQRPTRAEITAALRYFIHPQANDA
jgi:hypothetical protein